MGLAIVLVIRLTAPLAVLRWPFAGALLAIAADTVDILIFQITDFPRWGYHQTDKALDVWYIRWKRLWRSGGPRCRARRRARCSRIASPASRSMS